MGDFNEIMTFIGSVGFPIVMCCIMAWYVKYQADKHQDESAALREVIADNTKILEGLRQLLADKFNEK